MAKHLGELQTLCHHVIDKQLLSCFGFCAYRLDCLLFVIDEGLVLGTLKIAPLHHMEKHLYAISLMVFADLSGLYMVHKGEKGQPGIPGRCGCSASSSVNNPSDHHLSWGSYPRVPAVSQQCECSLGAKPECLIGSILLWMK